MDLVKPPRLHAGDKVAIVSTSDGMMGDERYLHRYEIGLRRLRDWFGLEPVTMPHALSGSAYLFEHPEARAADLMQAFADPEIKAVITAIGGEDAVRLLPYVDFDVIRQNPKIFTGFSDTTAHHFMMLKAGVMSYYGPALLTDFGAYGAMPYYTARAIRALWFDAMPRFEMEKCPYWIRKRKAWWEACSKTVEPRQRDRHGYEVLQGSGVVRGHLMGGCLDTFMMSNGTSVWPSLDMWEGSILFLETSEDCIPPVLVRALLRNLGAQGILGVVRGMLFGKPYQEVSYEQYKPAIRQVLHEYGRDDLPVLYNVNIGHSVPIGILPYGAQCELDVDSRRITLLEACVS